MLEIVSVIQNQATLNSQLHPAIIALVLAVAVGLSILLGNFIAKALRSEAHGWRLATIFSVFSIAILAIVLNWPPKFGVDLRGGITIIGQLRQDVETSERVDIKTMIPQLIARVDPSGTQEILIRALGTDKIEVVIPDVGMDEATRIWNRLTQAGELRFRIVADRNYHSVLTTRASDLIQLGIPDNVVRERVDPPTDNGSGKIIGRWYELGREDPQMAGGGVVPFKVMPLGSQLIRDGKSKQLLSVQNFRGPAELAKWTDEQKINRVEILCVEPADADDVLNVEGEHLQSASSGIDNLGRPAVLFSMTRDGMRRMGTLTSRNKSEGSRIPLLAIVSDGKLISAPSINSTITDRGIIEGRFSQREVDDLVANLKAGKLEVTLSENPISQDFQQSTIGEELKQRGILACVVSLVIIAVVMCIYYRFGGFVASFVLLLNLILVMALVMVIKQPLTLTGLAGIVLTIGMSVDANVLIYERIREELKRGAALRMAIRNGYDRAMVTIVDSNITTLLTGFVLYVIGTEQLKGFSVTLILGILTSMFTAIFCSRVILELAERNKYITNLNMMHIFGGGVIDFIGRRRTWYAVSLSAIVLGLLGTYLRGTEIFDHDLRGGSTARIVLNEDTQLDVQQVREMLSKFTGKVSDREPVQFSVASISSTEFPNRVFKVDSNIPIWEGEGAAPYKQIREVLVEVFGSKLMQLSVDYDPAKLQVSRLDVQPAPANGPPIDGKSPTGSTSQQSVPVSSFKPFRDFVVLASAVNLANPFRGILVQDTPPTSQEPGATPEKQETTEGKNPAAASEQDKSAPEIPANAAPPTASPETQDQPPMSAVDRFVATVELKFAQPISRASIIDALVDAAKKTNQVALEKQDVQVLAAGKDPEDLSVKSTVWNVTLNIGRESDAKLILDSLQADYNGQPYFPTISGVGGQIAAQTQWRALAAIMASLVIIVMYVWIRFQNVGFGMGAVIALVHDVLITLGAVALSFWLAPFLGILQVENFRISLAVIAAFLTLIGYSINDTIVVFDRIREVRGKRPELTAEMMNISISQTLSRTILTSTLTLIAVMVLYFVGGDSIHGFAFSLVIGIVVGTYSSTFIASPVALWLINRSMKRHATGKKIS